MNRFMLNVLEYPRIREQVAEEASSSLGKERIAALEPTADAEEVSRRLAATAEGMDLLRLKGDVSLGGVRDIRPSLRRAEVGGLLNTNELLDIAGTVNAGRKLKNQVLQVDEEHPLPIIRGWIERIEGLRPLEEEITRRIDEQGEVSDHASPTLRQIRNQIRQVQREIRTTLEGILRNPGYQKMLQESLITLRNDRYVIPVKQEYRSAFGGIVHDQSASGSTLFIEPASVVTLNNRLRQWEMEEQREVERILRELTAQVAAHVDVLRQNVEALAELDLILAKARYARRIRGVCPRVETERVIRLKRARHPLIPIEKAVPIDITLGDPHQGIIITGPNTGGKTVCLKTVGLLALMTQAGLPIPADEGSSFPVFSGIFADIGDEQSIEQSLSTFSSHMTQIIRILKQADDHSLVLLDELGAGTDPTEGAALAIAILQDLLDEGCLVVATTHYSELKQFAHAHPGVTNASVEFDVRTLRPTYRLLVGVPGKSNAFAIAERLGLSTSIIEKAKAQLSTEEHRLEEMIAALSRDRAIAEEERKRAEALRQEAESLQRELKEKLSRWEEEKERLRESARREAQTIVSRARREAEDVLRQLREWAKNRPDELKEHQLIEARKRLDNAVPEARPVAAATVAQQRNERIEPGDEVMVLTVKQRGRVLEDLGEEEYQVQVGILKMKVHRRYLEKVKTKKPESESGVTTSYRSASNHVRPELDLRGKMVEDALAEIDKYLDSAVVAGYQRVSLIHGKGTGALRTGVHQFLRRHPHVKGFRLGGPGEGGSGVTVVELA
ncbi:endonuclease MutS2 [Polycladomyces subterraneus]|uniref:Endonuclease MutS2 n=1 Tax=Polycladomyces subterraneus TaxID=1016997 RepID=A0ABT8IJE8_9BACL|nr:endonuclease MutS2 [Polycladomyces subterraneus]MDN4592864.1 endonuclease MutS2 [Polycladomyces subterraneus]